MSQMTHCHTFLMLHLKFYIFCVVTELSQSCHKVGAKLVQSCHKVGAKLVQSCHRVVTELE